MRPWYIVLLGAPGAGKGTQAARLSEALGIPHVASGDLFRDNLERRTPLGLQARRYMDEGKLVPDDVTVAMVMARLAEDGCRAGVLLDGFPRTTVQAQALDRALAEKGTGVRAVLCIRVPEQDLITRLSGRLICKSCQAAYHVVFNPPKVAGVCDVCGGELYQRPDDTLETVKRRLRVYVNQTAPLIEYYLQQGVLQEVDGAQDIDAVHQSILEALGVPEGGPA